MWVAAVVSAVVAGELDGGWTDREAPFIVAWVVSLYAVSTLTYYIIAPDVKAEPGKDMFFGGFYGAFLGFIGYAIAYVLLRMLVSFIRQH